MIKLAIFDLDGTTLNTLGDLRNALNAMLAARGYPERSLGEVRSFVGNGIRKLVERGFPEALDENQIDEAYADFMDYYEKHCMDTTVPYEGIVPFLRDLSESGVHIAIVSNKNEDLAKLLCEKLLGNLAEYVIGVGKAFPKKPDPSGTKYVMNQLKADCGNTLYIGDSLVDVQTAQNAGVKGVFATWGFCDKDILLRAGVRTVDTVAELKEYIMEGEAK